MANPLVVGRELSSQSYPDPCGLLSNCLRLPRAACFNQEGQLGAERVETVVGQARHVSDCTKTVFSSHVKRVFMEFSTLNFVLVRPAKESGLHSN